MKFRFQPWLILLLLVGVCVSIIGLVAYFRSRPPSTAELLSRLPAADALIVSVDFDALRRAGLLELLSASDVVQEPEYQAFVKETGFDYLRDLDSALLSFHPDGTFLLLRGRFAWGALDAYVTRQGGICYNSFCRLTGSTPDRRISFFPLQPGLMGMAVSRDDSAAVLLMARRPENQFGAVPVHPVWSIIPGGLLKSTERLPSGTRMFARALSGAERVILSAGPRDSRLELLLEVTCRSPAEASELTAQLDQATALLRDMIARDRKQPNPRDLSGVLSAGVFSKEDRRVLGRWPLERVFLESLAGGKL